MSTRRIIVAHGYDAHPRKHWFPWLEEQYAPGVVSVVALPTPATPVLDAWRDSIAAEIGTPDESTVVVGHSLGAISSLLALASIPGPWSVGGIVLVSGFAERLPGYTALDPFADAAAHIDLPAIAARAARVSVVVSDNDRVVPPVATLRLAAQLGAPVTVVAGAGHFIEQEGPAALTFPTLLPLIDPAGAGQQP